MKVFLAVAAKARGAAERATQTAMEAIEAAFPVPQDTVTRQEWHAPGVALLAWSNEPGRPLVGSAGLSGYLADPADLPEALAGRLDLGGCYSVFAATPQGVTAVTGPTGADPVYYAETPELHVVGSRALLVHLVATGGRVELDPLALQAMVGPGYFLSDETPYRGVHALPPATRLTTEGPLRRLEEVPLPGRGDVASALVAAVEPLRAVAEPVRLTLTGGRDSRLVAVLLKTAGVPFVAVTYGADDHPDVVLARQVARRLGVEHQVVPPKPAAAQDPRERTLEVLRACEGMTSAYENIARYAPFQPRPSLGGQGGEILRGGFLAGLGTLDGDAVARRLRSMFLGHEKLLVPEAAEHARTLAKPWLERATPDTLDHLYLRYRVGRWHAASRAGAQRGGLRVQPFLDHRVVAAALALDPVWRRSERLVHELLRQYAPGLAGLPLEGRPWRFEAEATKAKAVPKPPDWRAEAAAGLKPALPRSPGLARIVRLDRAALDAAKPAPVWNLYTVASLLDVVH
ncbi:asparagine synthase C-terminal domain-containing protein [Thermoactinospora rubra]|uniref:asparagine synthase-related protein n=1 Tax=Thermoactinospora rubra TaxID=1088767 RepID=UPI000A11E352|nr:asparagine synthase C-terminal domain-containing protein [Thermoactinospora rubra]